MIRKYSLLSPGPTPLPEDVLSVASEPLIHHRTPEFSAVLLSVTEGLQYVFGTSEDVYVLASSGTGAMEAAIVNTFSPGDRVLGLSAGKFGERWSIIARSYGLEVTEIVLEWGEDFTKEQLAEALRRHPGIKGVLATLSETSTGAVYDIQGFGEVVSQTDGVLVVDGISGVGATPCPMDAWHVDVLLSASQKSFMAPPGLAYIAFSPKAWERVERSSLPRYYFDIRRARKALREQKTTPWTPAVSLVFQQKKALERIRAMGLEKLIDHHRILGETVRAGTRALGLGLLAKKPGNILTAVRVPSGIDGARLVHIMKSKYRRYIAGGQGPYQGKIFRIAHLGYMDAFDILGALSALEMTLCDLGYSVEKGSAVRAAETILSKEKWE